MKPASVQAKQYRPQKIDCISSLTLSNISVTGFKTPARNVHTISTATINLEDTDGLDYDPDMGLFVQRWGVAIVNKNGFTIDFEVNGIVEPLYNGSEDETSTLLVSNPASIVAITGKKPMSGGHENFIHTLIESFNEVIPNMSTDADAEAEISSSMTFLFHISNRNFLKK